MANTTLGQFYDSISSQLEYNNQQLLEEKQRRIDDINRQTALLQEAEARKNTDPDWLRNRINQKLEDIKNTYKSKAEMYAAIKNDPELRGQFTSDNAIWDVIGKLTGTYRADDLQPLNKEVSAEDDTSNSWLYRQFVKAERGAESVIRDMSSSVNDALGGMGLTEGSYDYKIRKENEHISELPLIELNNIDEKQNLISHLSSELSAIESEISQASYLDLPQLLQQKANLQKQIQLTTLTPEEQKLVDDGTYADYKGSIANIQQLQEDKAKWVGDTWLTWIDKDIVNDVDSYHQYIKEAKARGLDKQYEDAGLEPSWLNLSYALDKSLQMAGDAEWSRVVGEVAPFMLLELGSGGTATPGLVGGLSLRGLTKAGTTFLANQLKTAGTRRVASYGLLGSDAYSRYCEYISEQYAKDPKGTVDKLRAAEGAIAGVVADFFGSTLAVGVAGKAYKSLAPKLPGKFKTINDGILTTLEGEVAKGMPTEMQATLSRVTGDLANKGIDFTDNIARANRNLNALNRAERGTTLAGKLLNTATAPARAVEGVNRLDKSLSRIGLAPGRDAGKAGAYLGLENTMSEMARQYGSGTDFEDMDWNQVAQATASGLGAGTLFHYPGVALHGVGNVSKGALNKLLKKKDKIIPLNDVGYQDFKEKYMRAEGGYTDEHLKAAIEYTKNQQDQLLQERNKAIESLKKDLGEDKIVVDKAGKVSLAENVTLSKKEQKLFNSTMKSIEGLDALIDRTKTLLDTSPKADSLVNLADIRNNETLKKAQQQVTDLNNTDATVQQKATSKDLDIVSEEFIKAANEAVSSKDINKETAVKKIFQEAGFSNDEVSKIIESFRGEQSASGISFEDSNIDKDLSDKIKSFLNRTGLPVNYFQGITKDTDVAKALTDLVNKNNETNRNNFINALSNYKAKSKDNDLKKANLWSNLLTKDNLKKVGSVAYSKEITDTTTLADMNKSHSVRSTVSKDIGDVNTASKDSNQYYRRELDDYLETFKDRSIAYISLADFNDFLDQKQKATLENSTESDFSNKKDFIRNKDRLNNKLKDDKVKEELFNEFKKQVEKAKKEHNDIVNTPLYEEESLVDTQLQGTAEINGIKANMADYYEKASVDIGGKKYWYVKATDSYKTKEKISNLATNMYTAIQSGKTITNEDRDNYNKLLAEIKNDSISKQILEGVKADISILPSDSNTTIANKLAIIGNVYEGANQLRDAILKSQNRKFEGNSIITNRYSFDDIIRERNELRAEAIQADQDRELTRNINNNKQNWLKDYKDSTDLSKLLLSTLHGLGIRKGQGSFYDTTFEDITGFESLDKDKIIESIKAKNIIVNRDASITNLDLITQYLDRLIKKAKDTHNVSEVLNLRTLRSGFTVLSNLINDTNLVTHNCNGISIGTKPQHIDENSISSQVAEMYTLLPTFISTLNKVGIQSDSSTNVDDLIETDWGTYIHAEEASDEVAFDVVSSVAKSQTLLKKQLAGSLKESSKSVSDFIDLDNLITDKTTLDTVFNNILSKTKSPTIKKLINAVAQKDFYTAQEVKDYINNLSSEEKANIILAVASNQAWLISQGFGKSTTPELAKMNASNTAVSAYRTATEVETSKAFKNLVKKLSTVKGAEAYIKIFVASSLAQNNLISNKVFTELTVGDIHKVMDRATYNGDEKALTDTAKKLLDKDTPPTEAEINALTVELDRVFVRQNYYKWAYNKALDNARNLTTKTSAKSKAETLSKFAQAYSTKDKVIYKYNSRDNNLNLFKEHYTKADIISFRQMIRDSNKLRAEVIAYRTENYPSLTKAQEDIFDEVFNPKNTTELLGIDQDGALVDWVGDLLASYITHTKGVNNSVEFKTGTNNVTISKAIASLTTSLADTSKYQVEVNKDKTTVFSDGFNGISSFASNVASTPISVSANKVAGKLKKLTRDMLKVINVDKNTALGKIFGIEAFGRSFLNEGVMAQVVASAYMAISTISGGKASDEFKEALASFGCSREMIKYYENSNILDFNTLAEQLGNQIINQLGLKFKDFKLPKEQLAMELGGLALDSLNTLGVVELQHISMNAVKDGKPVTTPLGKGGLANSIRGVLLKDSLYDEADLIESLNYIDTDGEELNYLDETLGGFRKKFERPMTQKAYEKDFKNLSKDFNSKEARVISAIKDSSKAGYVTVDYENNIAKVVVKDITDGKETIQNVVYLEGEQLIKTDDTMVEADRLLELALKQVEPVYNNIEVTEASLSIFDQVTEAELRNINDWNEKDAKRGYIYKAIRQYVAYNSIGSPQEWTDPNTKAIGDTRINIRNKNITIALKAKKNWEYFKKQKEKNKGKTEIPYYFKQVNSVNNRSIVRGLLMNYREDKSCRPYYDFKNKLPTCDEIAKALTNSYNKDITAEQVKKDLTLFAKASVLATLGFGYDKFNLSKTEDTWNKIHKDLSELIKVFVDTSNTDIKERVKALNKFYKKYGTGSFNAEAVSTLHELASLTKDSSLNDLSKFEWNDDLKDKWHIKFEIDGLTNGPAIKGWVGTAFFSNNDTLSKDARLAAGISSATDYEKDILGSFIDLKDSGEAKDTYVLNGEYVKDKVIEHLSLHPSASNKVNKFLATTYISKFKSDAEPSPNIDSLSVDAIYKVILSRNMLKPPTMVTNYGAGYKALINKMISTFTDQASSLFATYVSTGSLEARADLLNWLRKAVELNGNKAIVVTYDNGSSIQKVFINADGTTSLGTDIFAEGGRDFLQNCTIDLSINKTLTEEIVNNFVDPMWDGMTDALEPFKRYDSIHGKVADATANMLNVAIMDAYNTILEKYPHIADNPEELEQEIEKHSSMFDTILSIGYTDANITPTQLNAIKDSKVKILTNLFNSILSHKDGKTFIKNQVRLAYKEGLGGALVPVSTHTQDSAIMHLTQNAIRKLIGETVGVHDAIIASPSQVALAGTDLNKHYFLQGIRSYETFANRNRQLADNISKFAMKYGSTNPDMVRALNATLRLAENEYTKIVLAKASYLKEQIAKPEKERDVFNQYAYLNYTAYQPSVPELQAELDRLLQQNHDSIARVSNTDVAGYITYLNKSIFTLAQYDVGLKGLCNITSIGSKASLNLDKLEGHLDTVEHLQEFIKSKVSNNFVKLRLSNIFNQFNKDKTNIEDDLKFSAITEDTTNPGDSLFTGSNVSRMKYLYNRMISSVSNVTVTDKNIIQDAYLKGMSKTSNLIKTFGLDTTNLLLTLVGASSDVSRSEIYSYFNTFGSETESNIKRLEDKFITLDEAKKLKARVNIPGDRLDMYAVEKQIEKLTVDNMVSPDKYTRDNAKKVAIDSWNKSFTDNVFFKYKSLTDQDVVVFSMSSLEDVMELRAISRLMVDGKLGNFKILIQPNITKENKAVNKNTQYMKNLTDTLGSVATWYARTVPNSNKDLSGLEFILGHRLNKTYIDEGMIVGNEHYAYLEGNNSSPKTEPMKAVDSGVVFISKCNEYGNTYSNVISDISDVSYTDFTSLDLAQYNIKDLGANDIATLDITEEEIKEYSGYERVNKESVDTYDLHSDLDNIKQHTMVVDTLADGTINNSKVDILFKTDDQLRELYNQYKKVLARRMADYYNGKGTKNDLLKPILVTTEGHALATPMKAIFRVTFDNIVEAKSLRDLLDFGSPSSGVVNLRNEPRLNPEHPLAKMFTKYKMKELTAFVKAHQNDKGSITIPFRLFDDAVVDKDAPFGTSLSIKNAMYMDAIADTKGISDVVYFTKGNVVDSPDSYRNISSVQNYYVTTSNVKEKNIKHVAQESNKNLWSTVKGKATKIVGILKGYSKADIKLNAKQVKIVGDKLQIATKQDLHNAMSKALADDKARGIDTSHLESMMGLVENLAMKIQLVETKDSSDSGEGVISSGLADKAIYVQYGKNYTGSSLEVLMHEIMHGIFEHLHLDPSAQRMAMQLFKYASSNLKLEHFECDKAEAERIMKYIFNDSSANNLQEFLAYAMTNSDFQAALTNMGINKDIAKEFFTKTKSVTSRLFNTLCTNLDSDTVPTNMVQAVRDIFNVTYANSQKIWEAQRQFDTLSEEEKIDYLKTNGTFDSLVRDGLTKDSPLLKTLLDIQAINNNVFGGNDNTMSALTDAIRSLSDNHLGFVRELATSLEAVSPRNYEFIRLRQRAKVAIDMQRERVSSAINSYVAELTKDLPTKVKHQLTKFLVQADVSCLFDANTKLGEVSKLIKNPKARTQKIREIEQQLRSYQYGNYYINASKGLSSYITTGINTSGLGYRNAYEITSFAGSRYWNKAKDSNAGDLVDKLATLYAIDYYDKQDNNIYNKIPDETLGALLNLHNSIKTIEQEYVMRDTEQRYHIPKGQIHGGKTVGSYKLYPMVNKEAVKWSLPTSMTPTKLDPFYKGMFGDNSFITTHHAFRSSIPVDAGIYAMTDKFMGRVAKGIRVGNEKVSDDVDDLPKIRDYLSTRINNLNTTNPSFINPNSVDGGIVLSFATGGNLIGANFELNPVETNKKIGRNVKFTNVLGDLLGSSIERVSAPNVNTDIANTAIKLYEETKDKSNYFWIKEDSENPKERDYYRRIPYEAKVIFKEKYGDQGIPVPKSAATIVLGKEAVSSKKIDTEYYEAVKECRNTVADYAKHLLRHGSVGLAEDLASYLTKIGKSNIVIKGLSVSINNILSNTLTLTRHGLSPIEAIRDQMEGVQQVRELEALQAQLNPIIVKSTISNLSTADIKKKNAITQMMKALPIYPLYSEGVLGSIVEDLDDSDSFIKDVIDKYFSGTTANLLHNLANDEKAVAFKMFKDLADIGDKAGKYALFKHQPDTMPLKERLRRSTETFIDYAIPLPTGFDIVERVGLQNFLKYPLGIQSELINSLSQRPDDALKSLMIQASLGFSLPDAYSSLLGIGNFERGLNFPGLGIFFDSLSCLPTAKIANNLMDTF